MFPSKGSNSFFDIVASDNLSFQTPSLPYGYQEINVQTNNAPNQPIPSNAGFVDNAFLFGGLQRPDTTNGISTQDVFDIPMPKNGSGGGGSSSGNVKVTHLNMNEANVSGIPQSLEKFNSYGNVQKTQASRSYDKRGTEFSPGFFLSTAKDGKEQTFQVSHIMQATSTDPYSDNFTKRTNPVVDLRLRENPIDEYTYQKSKARVNNKESIYNVSKFIDLQRSSGAFDKLTPIKVAEDIQNFRKTNDIISQNLQASAVVIPRSDGNVRFVDVGAFSQSYEKDQKKKFREGHHIHKYMQETPVLTKNPQGNLLSNDFDALINRSRDDPNEYLTKRHLPNMVIQSGISDFMIDTRKPLYDGSGQIIHPGTLGSSGIGIQNRFNKTLRRNMIEYSFSGQESGTIMENEKDYINKTPEELMKEQVHYFSGLKHDARGTNTQPERVTWNTRDETNIVGKQQREHGLMNLQPVIMQNIRPSDGRSNQPLADFRDVPVPDKVEELNRIERQKTKGLISGQNDKFLNATSSTKLQQDGQDHNVVNFTNFVNGVVRNGGKSAESFLSGVSTDTKSFLERFNPEMSSQRTDKFNKDQTISQQNVKQTPSLSTQLLPIGVGRKLDEQKQQREGKSGLDAIFSEQMQPQEISEVMPFAKSSYSTIRNNDFVFGSKMINPVDYEHRKFELKDFSLKRKAL